MPCTERLQIAEGMNWVVLCCTVIDLQQFQTSGDYMPMTGYNRREMVKARWKVLHTDRLTGIGARDTRMSKKLLMKWSDLKNSNAGTK